MRRVRRRRRRTDADIVHGDPAAGHGILVTYTARLGQGSLDFDERA
ncbi:hypothetical protein [Streptomyces sp. NBC_00057]